MQEQKFKEKQEEQKAAKMPTAQEIRRFLARKRAKTKGAFGSVKLPRNFDDKFKY